MKKPSLSFMVPFVVLFLACSSGGTSSAGSDSGASPPTGARRSPNVISAAELAETPELNALQAVQRLRGRWLRGRGNTTFGIGGAQQGVKVYVNGSRRGLVDELARYRVTDIEELRFMSGREATSRYGTDHAEGVIHVILKSR